MRASGEWHGRATFSPEILRALATVPPIQNPIKITYKDGHVLIGSMTILCEWSNVSQAFIEDLQNPSILDLLAMGRTVARVEGNRATELGKKIRNAGAKAERRIKNAAAQLEELEITEVEIRRLVEERIKSRLVTEG